MTMSDKSRTELPPGGVCLSVPHIYQMEDWDCGLACSRMILKFIHPETDDESPKFDEICKKLGFGESIWTIDLAHLMVQFNVKHQLYTITLGVDPTYQEVDYYINVMKSEFVSEQQRVNNLFASAARRGIQVEKRSVTIAEIEHHLCGQNPAIVLVDNTILQCEWCRSESNWQKGCGDCFPLSHSRKGGSFVGHFIVLCGFDKTKNRFLYRNPGISQELCCCSFSNLDEARQSHGTDEDILFIYR
ncbi:protein GUCD1-like isoform X2 [Acanthaster planci]|uniref:Protein GUCD1-like isoform X2 n=1 Tax=Acanthaster planci TaxID=133434 RepID=A0A8B7YJ51_ACAPL|nr:protein GUCD1-like isoform X2 [Acanthaster planci]